MHTCVKQPTVVVESTIIVGPRCPQVLIPIHFNSIAILDQFSAHQKNFGACPLSGSVFQASGCLILENNLSLSYSCGVSIIGDKLSLSSSFFGWDRLYPNISLCVVSDGFAARPGEAFRWSCKVMGNWEDAGYTQVLAPKNGPQVRFSVDKKDQVNQGILETIVHV